MTKIKNVILRNRYNYREPGLEHLQRWEQNGEVHASITGEPQQINRYLQDAPILSERLRTLKNIPHYRTFKDTIVEIY